MKTCALLALVIVISGCDSSSERITSEPATKTFSKVVLASEVKWEQLNPARGDQSPQAATLWGDRNGSVPTGFLFKPVDGFRSPPHIHNVTYRGVVISGLVHNDDPEAQEMWMPKGSFWTQPAGEVHITAAQGNNTLAYIEIDQGPYLVLPTGQAFDRGERPVNVDASNIVWLDALNTGIDQSAIPAAANGPKVAFLWGNPQDNQLNGTLVKFPAGFTGTIRSSSTFHAVVIQGQSKYQGPDGADMKTMTPGSYFSSQGESGHQISCTAAEECILYVRQQGKLTIVPAQAKN